MGRKYETEYVKDSELFDYQELAKNDDFMQRAECVWISEAQIFLGYLGMDKMDNSTFESEVRQIMLAEVFYTKYVNKYTYLVVIEDNIPMYFIEYTEIVDFDNYLGMQFELKKQTPWSAVVARLAKSAKELGPEKSSLKAILGDLIEKDNTTSLTCRLGTLNEETVFYHDNKLYYGKIINAEFLVNDDNQVDFDDYANEVIELKLATTTVSLIPTLKVLPWSKEEWAEDADIWLGTSFKVPWRNYYKKKEPIWRELCTEVEGFWFRHGYDSEEISTEAMPD